MKLMTLFNGRMCTISKYDFKNKYQILILKLLNSIVKE